MAGYFPQNWLDELRGRADLVSIVAEYVPMNQKGRRYWACCPFHQEKTPSFSVDSEKQMYYCFGCKASGNVFSFIMAAERLDFADAVKYLAEKYNVPLPQNEEDERRYRAEAKKRERMIGITTDAARFFRDALNAPEGAAARAYLKKRGVSEAMVRRFGLGYAPDSWNRLHDHLTEEKVTDQEGQALGLLSSSKGRTYDAFRNRVMYPIFDDRGRVVAFGGRVLDSSLPKYINSPDTPIFNKRRLLYGLHLLKKERELPYAIITEGYMDVIAMWQAGIPGAMATMGTSMTAEQARMIRRYVSKVILLYDGDSAGQNASLRGMDILVDAGLEVRVASLPDGLDPDEMIRQRGKEAMLTQLENAMTLTAFRMASEKKKWDLSRVEERTRYAMVASEIIGRLESPIERESYLKTLQVETGFSMQALMDQMAGQRASLKSDAPQTERRRTETAVPEATPDVRAQRQLIRALIRLPIAQWPKETEQLTREDFDCPACIDALTLLKTLRSENEQAEPADLYTRLCAQMGEEMASVLNPMMEEEPQQEILREWILRRIQTRKKRQQEEMIRRLSSDELSEEEKRDLMQRIQQTARELHT